MNYGKKPTVLLLIPTVYLKILGVLKISKKLFNILSFIIILFALLLSAGISKSSNDELKIKEEHRIKKEMKKIRSAGIKIRRIKEKRGK
ncbi:hypothetical protein [Gemelliphila palaticanis]|uniref:Uncharacterized protein n=1 Tax=Gemelliphila palaticanis TaxID=81950 RepID=A0ABX2SZA2_9BACL|nr:hypothetical protein [Gemella palaticanis]MBF0715473.1 hypothetical protein [Gemella palaticanis]NYS47403.1 hypothetical protein [Gemella palaticanis]